MNFDAIAGRAGAAAAFVALAALAATLVVAAPAHAVPSSPTVSEVAEALAAASLQAADPANFDPGYIISDELFFAGGSMSEADIQAFLVRMGTSCAQANGLPCLKNYTSDTFSRPAVALPNHCGAYTGAAAEPASRIIYKVSVACGISPKVLLVMLQKEQGLITKSSPTAANYRAAMGYGCPDTAPCDAQFYGFYNQVYKAAWQFRQYAVNPTSWRYRIGFVPVQFHPNAACGAANVTIRNQATANLYIYTPYQPNAAAMANLYGTGDACSSYGNRNFWVFYNDWFGPTGTIGYLSIDRAYARWGGASGVLGAAVGTANPITANGGGLVQAYENGAIAWSQSRGAFAVMGDIRTYFGGKGGIAGSLGWPASDPTAMLGGTVQSFAGGAVVSSPAGVYSIVGSMRTYFGTTGGIGGPLGWPSADASTVGSLVQQPFSGGIAYVRANGTGSYLLPATDDAWKSAGGVSGSLGWPTTDPIVFTVDGGGVVQGFEGGVIAGGTGLTAYPLTSALRTAYNAGGGVGGALGWPTSAASCAGSVCTQAFQRGDTYASTSGANASFSVDPIGASYAERGGPAGALGWPATGMIPFAANGGGSVQAFTNAALASSSAGVFSLTGGVRIGYNAAGGTTGPLGWPTAEQTCATASRCQQSFQGGVVLWSTAQGSAYSLGAIASAYLALGGPTGSLGWPVTGDLVFAANGGGRVQAYASGAIAASASGAFALTGGVRDFYNANGGLSGSLGWPTGAMSCAGAVCTQTFQGGTITYTTGVGGKIG